MVRETERASDIIHDWNNNQKVFAINLAGSRFQRPGLPDCITIVDGIHIWIEFKNEKKEPDNLQKRIHQLLAKQGIHVYIVNFTSQKEWHIDKSFSIKFNVLKEGYKLLLATLISLERSRLDKRVEPVFELMDDGRINIATYSISDLKGFGSIPVR